ncbi:hypothetical protein ACIBI9_48990 [Nonomuraea sp. NPDC050451]|uniref:hypothetical protein n=1 Tax=Nonomuraea sp. NPDC050451 TaxID=3364364 RepID=UPI0037ADAA29
MFDSRERLKAALGKNAEYRAAGPVRERFAATTWGQHMSILSLFYRWAMEEGHAEAEPFTYRTARALFAGTGREVRVNLAVRRTPKPHVTIKYLEPDFTGLFLDGLRGLAPDGGPDPYYRGRELARNGVPRVEWRWVTGFLCHLMRGKWHGTTGLSARVPAQGAGSARGGA